MELRHLRYFVCVAEERNVRRAAKRLHMSQPPLTRQIHQLEEELGTPLFSRVPRGVELTDAGRTFLADAREILASVDEASARAGRAGRGHAGRLDIALFGTGIFGVIPTLLRAHLDAHPGVEFTLHNMTKHEQLEALERGRISLAFNRLMRPVPFVESEVLLTEPLVIAAPTGHPLTDAPTSCLAALEGHPMVVFPTGYRPSFIDKVHALCGAVGFAPNVVAEVADVVHGIVMVATTGVSCLVPHSASNLKIPGVTYVPLRDQPAPDVDLCCIYRSGDHSPVLHELLRSMREAAAELQERLRAPGGGDASSGDAIS